MKRGRRFHRVAVSALLAAGVAAVFGGAPARAAVSPAAYSDGTYVMASVNSGMCLSINGTGLGDWTSQQPCTDTWELWYFHNVGGQNYTIASTAANQCLAIGGAKLTDSATALVWTCYGGAEQIWTMVPEGTNGRTFEIVNLNSGKCLAIGAAQKQAGAGAIQWTCDNGAEQAWQIIAP